MARDRLAAMRVGQSQGAGDGNRNASNDSYGDAPSYPSARSQSGRSRDPFADRGSTETRTSEDSYGSGSGGRRPPPPGLPNGPRARRNPRAQTQRSNTQDSYEEERPAESPYYNDPPPPRSAPAARGRAAQGALSNRPRGRAAAPLTDPFADRGEQEPMEMREVSTARRRPPRTSAGGPPQPRIARAGEKPREVSDTSMFFNAISQMQEDLREFQGMIDGMAELQKRTLDAVGEEQTAKVKEDVEGLAGDVRKVSASLKSRIQGFEADHSLLRQRGDPTGDLGVRTQQLAALKSRFVESVQRYAEVEQAQRRAIKAKVERQLRIVKPDATDEEVRAAFEDEQNGGAQIFQQALVSSQRTGAARNALREVQSRGEDIKRIEKTITELAQLFNDMAVMVEEQDVIVQHIEKTAVVVNEDIEQAEVQLVQAKNNAKQARSTRKCCFIIIIIILIAIGIVVTVMILSKTGVGGSNSTGSTTTTTSAAANASATGR